MKIIIRNLQKKIPVDPKRISKALQKVLIHERATRIGEITVSLVSDLHIKRLNKRFLGKNTPTDVLAFDISDPKHLYADIVVSTDTALRNSKVYHTTPRYEMYLYCVHGLLHLLGYGDLGSRQRQVMQDKERYHLNQPWLSIKPKQ